MNKIDTSKWKSFKMKELGFDVYHGSRLKKTDRKDGEIPFLTAGYINQGIGAYIGNAECETYNNAITVDMFGNSFYHNGLFAGDDNIYFFVNDNLSENIKLFIATIINRQNQNTFSYKEQYRQPNANKQKVNLPINKDGEPDFAYMEQYMQNRAAAVSDSLMALQSAKSLTNSEISTSDWKEFKIGDLFNLKRGNIKNLQLQKEGIIPVIAAAGYNQGIAGFYDVKGEFSDKITVSCNGAGCGSTFFHPYSFNINGDAMVLIEKEYIPEMAKLYITCLLNGLLKRKYSYQEKCSPQKAENETFKLPVDKNGNPDFEYMANFMKIIENTTRNKLNNLKIAL